MGAAGAQSQALAWRVKMILLRVHAMADKVQQDDKARRLAEQLRANLRRRKAQGRELKPGGDEKGAEDGGSQNIPSSPT